MIPDPPTECPLVGSGSADPAGSPPASRPGLCCWLCGYAIIDPPQIIGQRDADRVRVAHRYCLRVLGELELDLPSA